MGKINLSDISVHLTEEVLDKAFKEKTMSEDTIQSINITRATPIGDGLISAVFRINVAGEEHQTSFFVKGLIKDKLLRKTLRCARLFKREAIFFTKILPAFTKIQNSLGGNEHIEKFIPKCYSCHCDGEEDYILLEDLVEQGYTSMSGEATADQCYLAIRTLAHFHAISFALKHKANTLFSTLTKDIDELYYTEDNKSWYETFLNNGIEINRMALEVFEAPNTSRYYKKFVQVTSKDVYREMIQLASTKSEHYVICHGDAWLQNFLCNDKEAATVDFQLLRCASPSVDLMFLCLLCAPICKSKKTFETAIEYYYSFVQFYLRDLGLDIQNLMTIEDLWKEIRSYGKLGMLQLLTTIPLTSEPEFCDNLDDFEVKFKDVDRIPLEYLWRLRPLTEERQQLRFVNALRVAVDVGIL